MREASPSQAAQKPDVRGVLAGPAVKDATPVVELQHFQLKAVPLKPDALEWRERPHDDLVLAVAIAAWQAERAGPAFFIYCVSVPPPEPTWASWQRSW